MDSLRALINEELDSYNKVQIVKVYSKNNPEKVIRIIGNVFISNHS